MTPKIMQHGGWLNVNRACNLRCSWCYAKGTDYKSIDEMPLELALRLTRILHEAGVKVVTLIGGEPSLWTPLFEYLLECKAIGVKITLVTNGTRFGIDSFWDAYQRTPCDYVSLSIKAHNAQAFERMTGSEKFHLTKLGISRLLSRVGSSPCIVYSGLCGDDFIEIARFAVDCGAKSLGIGPGTPAFSNGSIDTTAAVTPGDFIHGLTSHYEELDRLFSGHLAIAIKLPLCAFPRDFITLAIERRQIITTCQLQHRTGLIFDPIGRLLPCNSLHEYPIGALDQEFHDAASLMRHLGIAEVSNFYTKINSYASEKCVNCPVGKYCGGGCPLFYGVYAPTELIKGWNS